MQLGLQIIEFDWPGGTPQIRPRLTQIARAAEGAGYTSIWLMDHFFQIHEVGPAEQEMLECYTTLSYLAGVTLSVRLGALVSGVMWRNPGVLIKQVTTLDVLSGGRANLGLGVAHFEREHAGFGVPLPPLKERFDRLEETLKIAHQMWSTNNGPFDGRFYQLAETINSPQPLTKPHPPILVGGGGEQRTLPLVARYADACNFMGDPSTIRRKLFALQERCAEIGRDFSAIERTVLQPLDPGERGENAARVVDQLGEFADAGIQTVIGWLTHVERISPIEVMGSKVIPQIKNL